MILEVYYFNDELIYKKWLCALVESEIKLLPILKILPVGLLVILASPLLRLFKARYVLSLT
jgi:hypothetical protein